MTPPPTASPAPGAPQRGGLVRSLLRPLYRSRLLRPLRESLRPDAPPPPAPDAEADLDEYPPTLDFSYCIDQAQQNYADLANPFDDYRRLVRWLETSKTRVVPVRELALEPASPERSRIALRHDVDADPVTALRMARFLASRGMAGSFYLLHTAPYYGQFHAGRLHRNPKLESWVHDFIVAGCELGIHNDALGANAIDGIDGPQALADEIRWLRDVGATIRGSVAHNSAPAYGAANSEIFVGRRLGTVGDHSLPIERLDEAALGLEYEGTFAVAKRDRDEVRARRFVDDRANANLRSEAWMRAFLLENPSCDWDVDMQVWVIGQDEWVVAGRPGGQAMFRWAIGLDAVLETLGGLPAGARCLIVLHPAYFSGSEDTRVAPAAVGDASQPC